MRLSIVDINLLKNLYRASKGLDEVTLFRRVKVSFSDFLTSSEKLQNYGLITYQDYIFRITNEGRQQYISKNPRILSDVQKNWKDIPLNFRDDAIAPEKLYIPSLSRLDDCFFE